MPDAIRAEPAASDLVESLPAGSEPAAGSPFTASIVPNPLRGSGTIRLETRRAGPVRMELFDIRGRRLGVLLNSDDLAAGRHTVLLDRGADDGKRLASGVYFCRIQTPEGALVLRVLALD